MQASRFHPVWGFRPIAGPRRPVLRGAAALRGSRGMAIRSHAWARRNSIQYRAVVFFCCLISVSPIWRLLADLHCSCVRMIKQKGGGLGVTTSHAPRTLPLAIGASSMITLQRPSNKVNKNHSLSFRISPALSWPNSCAVYPSKREVHAVGGATMPVTTTATPLNLPSPATPGRKVLDPRLRRLVHDLDRQASTGSAPTWRAPSSPPAHRSRRPSF